MIDLLLIVRDALASSLVGNLSVALHAREMGREVAVLFTQEALAAVAQGTFEWPRELSGQEMRWALADGGSALGLPVLGRGDGRQLDAKALVTQAREAGVVLYACPIWTALLRAEKQLPDWIQRLDRLAVVSLIQD